MKIHFSKMQGAGNDFVVLDETQGLLGLGERDYRFLADRRFGVGADQILSVRAGREGADFEYVIHNADGSEVEQCGNGARCFARYVVDHGLTQKKTIQVLTKAGMIAPTVNADSSVRVDMGAPVFELAAIPFMPPGAAHRHVTTAMGAYETWRLPLADGAAAEVSVVSMGNPHAVQVVVDVATAPVETQGPQIERHASFPRRVNAGFMQVVNRGHIKLRVYERGAGETLACGTGASAAVVAGIRLGLLDAEVRVDALGGVLHISWGGMGQSVFMSGPAVQVFEGEIELPRNND